MGLYSVFLLVRARDLLWYCLYFHAVVAHAGCEHIASYRAATHVGVSEERHFVLASTMF